MQTTLASITLQLALWAIGAVATVGVVIYKAFYGKDAKERKIEKLEVELERLKNETQAALAEGRVDDFLILDKQRVLVAKKRNRLLRRQQ